MTEEKLEAIKKLRGHTTIASVAMLAMMNEIENVEVLLCAAKSAPDNNLVHVPGAKFPLAWDREYFAVRLESDKERVECGTCDGTGNVILPSPVGDYGKEYDCPECEGEKKIVVAVKTEYRVSVYRVWTIGRRDCYPKQFCVSFKTDKSSGGNGYWLEVIGDGLKVMSADVTTDCKPVYIYDNREEAQAEADRLNREMGGKGEN